AHHHVFDDRVVFGLLGIVQQVRLVHTDDGTVRGDGDDTHAIRGEEFRGFRLRGTGHTGQLLVLTEVVLQRDGRVGLVLGLDGHALFGLNRLVQAIRVASTRKQTARVLINDVYLAVLHHVLAVSAV